MDCLEILFDATCPPMLNARKILNKKLVSIVNVCFRQSGNLGAGCFSQLYRRAGWVIVGQYTSQRERPQITNATPNKPRRRLDVLWADNIDGEMFAINRDQKTNRLLTRVGGGKWKRKA
jgi:hypothetical protein